ncbi:hypothetical protein EB796_017600 [Bugula neritina]|uniref:Protein kinase domain-containing protein n=1 Tax=Bugula neritina TaxID=10212 RepID=A0A7J7JD50_BUGNE|nr:hypothetical protein EB796_017600 [Bugula neritina]
MATNKLSTSLQKTHDKLKGFVGSGDEKSVKEVLGTLSTADKVKILCEPDRSHGFTLLHKAAMNDNMAVVRSMVASLPAADLHKILTAQNKVNETAVHAAAYKGFEDVVKCMLEQLPQPDLFKTLKVLDKHGYTAVFGAAKRGYVNVARCIRQLVAKADWAKLLMLKNNQSKTIIYWAAQEGNTELVKFLVETISDEDYVKLMTVKNSYGQSPIFRAASNGKLDTLKCLIDRVSGSELYRLLIDKSLEGLTPLHMAASSGLVDGIRELLGKLDPADRIEALNVKNKQGQTAKEMAVQEKQKEAAAILDEIKKQANNEIYGSAQRPKAVTTKSTSETEKSPASVTGSHLVTGISHKVVSSDSGVSSSETDSIPISREIARSATEATATMGDQGLADVLQEVEMGERLGSGGQATVYGGTWLGTPVAIKVLPDSEGFDLSAASMEQVEEYNAIKTLRHPNVVQFYGIAKLDNRIGLVMELCDTDLSLLLKLTRLQNLTF